MCESYYLYGADESTKQWSSLVEGDEQPDRSNMKICLDCCHASAAKFILGSSQIQLLTALGRYGLHLLLLKSSIIEVFRNFNVGMSFSLNALLHYS